MSTYALIKTAWQQRCDTEQNYSFTPFQRAWLTFKFTVCLLLNRTPRQDDYRDDYGIVAITDSHQSPCEWGTCYDWTEWQVGVGYLRNWWYRQEWDGSP